MEIIIFKKDEIPLFVFNGKKTVLINYNDISELKNENYGNFKDLDKTKARIDLLDRNAEKLRRAAAKYIHEYELVKLICKKQVISRAYFKLYEMIYFEPIIIKDDLNCLMLCEAPGGFIECISDIRRKKNLRTKFISISKPDQFIKYDRYLEETNLLYEDITENLNENVNKILLRFPQKLDLITADGGFDVKLFNGQEILSTKLLLCEIYIALQTQKIGGMFIIKFFDMFTHNSIVLYLILCTVYDFVRIIKPKTSRNCNSERYLSCNHFNGNNGILTEDMVSSFILTSETCTLLFPELNLNLSCFDKLKKIKIYNNIILYEQIKTINESIKMVNNKDVYFQNLLLNLFIEVKFKSERLSHLIFFKNILFTRIKKCVDFLRNYNINTNQIVYRLN